MLARFVVSDPEPFSAWVDACDALPRVELQSAGRALEIVKDVGDANEVADKHGVREFIGTHGLGHVRLATESNVSPVAGHPFWARPFPDVAIVHNGQLTNYYTWRAPPAAPRLPLHDRERQRADRGLELRPDGSGRLARRRSLERSLSELDGVFTYLLATSDGIALAKDRWAIKPVVAVVAPDGVAVATEEQSLRTLYQDEIDVEVYDGPSIVRVWPVGSPVPTGAAA